MRPNNTYGGLAKVGFLGFRFLGFFKKKPKIWKSLGFF